MLQPNLIVCYKTHNYTRVRHSKPHAITKQHNTAPPMSQPQPVEQLTRVTTNESAELMINLASVWRSHNTQKVNTFGCSDTKHPNEHKRTKTSKY